MEKSPLSSLPLPLPLMMTSVQEEIQSSIDYVDIVRDEILERFEELLQMILVSTNFMIC